MRNSSDAEGEPLERDALLALAVHARTPRGRSCRTPPLLRALGQHWAESDLFRHVGMVRRRRNLFLQRRVTGRCSLQTRGSMGRSVLADRV